MPSFLLCHSPLSWPCAERSVSSLVIASQSPFITLCFRKGLGLLQDPFHRLLSRLILDHLFCRWLRPLARSLHLRSLHLRLFIFAPVLLAFPSVRVRFRILVALPATSFSSAFLAILYPTSWWKFWGFQAVTMLLHCQRMPRAFFST